jgi:trk system potassium uptake protein
MQNIQKLRVVIVGAGEVGMNVAMKLSDHEEVEVTLIEANEERSALMKNNVNCRHIKGSGLNPTSLREAEVDRCDLFYAMTDADEVNLLSCQLAQEMILKSRLTESSEDEGESRGPHSDPKDLEGVKPQLTPCPPLGENHRKSSIVSNSENGETYLYARVRSEELYEYIQPLFPQVNVIFPERTCSKKIDELLHFQQVFDVVELEAGRLKLYGIKIHSNSSAVGQSLQNFTSDHKITIAAIARRTEVRRRSSRVLMIPWAEYEMEANDEIYFAASPKTLSLIHHIFASKDEDDSLSSLVIAGDTAVSNGVFQRFVNRSKKRQDHEELDIHFEGLRREFAMIVNSAELAEEIERTDPHGHAVVVAGSITDIDHLAKIGVGPKSTLLVSSTDEENLICALLARDLGCERILIVNNREQYADLIHQLGFDGIFSPRQLAVNEMVHQALKRLSKSAFDVSGSDDVEVRSFVVDKDSALCGLELKDLKSVGFPRKYAVIAALKNALTHSHTMPTGSDVLEEDSVAYIVAKSADFHKINAIFGRRKSRFRLWR